jgi:hypothetical protein
MNSSLRSKLLKIKRVCTKVAAKDTAYKPLEHLWSAEDPLAEHCGAVAYVVQNVLGGDVISGVDNDGIRWLWNRIPSANGPIDVALTEDDLRPPVLSGKCLPPRKTVNPRFALFYSRYLLAT